MMRTIAPTPILAAFAVAALAGAAHASESPPAAARPANPPLFSKSLAETPGKQLVVVNLTFAPAGGPARPHRHPGSVYVYVTKGAARLGVEGQPVQVVNAGEGFFEAPGVLHVVSESASATEPAYGIAVMIVPDGAALSVAEPAHAGH